ncbi:MAG: hypothetical protein CMM02_04365, partial [Rhodopirellula sp.]|nr:hypothetical protein [Rhodopirellula sp.]
MKKIVFSAVLTAVFSWVAFSFIGSQQVSSEAVLSPRALESSQRETSVVSNMPIQASSSAEWKTITAKEIPSLEINNTEDKNDDPISAFKRWANDFMAGTGSELEGIRLAKIRRREMAQMI